MQKNHQILITAVILMSATLGISSAHAKVPTLKASPWSSLPVGNCLVQIKNTNAKSYSFIYCKGAPKKAAMGIVDHTNVTYSAASLASAQCLASANGRDIRCFSDDFSRDGVVIPQVLAIPAAKSCDALNWQPNGQGELYLHATGCMLDDGSKNPQATSVSMSDYIQAAEGFKRPRLSNVDGDLTPLGGVGDVID